MPTIQHADLIEPNLHYPKIFGETGTPLPSWAPLDIRFYTRSQVDVLAANIQTGLVYNVKDYGAVGNGVANDTAAIQAALDACGSLIGGVVFFPSGIYKIASINPKGNTILRGEGNLSILKVSATNLNAIEVDGQPYVTIESLCVDGQSSRSSSDQTKGFGIHFTNSSTNGTVRDTTVKNCRVGIMFEYGSSVGWVHHSTILDCRDNHITSRKSKLADLATAPPMQDFIFTDNHCDGLDVYDSITLYFTDGYTIISDNLIQNINGTDSSSAIQLEGGTNGLANGVTVTGNVCHHCERGLTVSSVSYATITGNTFHTMTDYGMKLQNSFYSTISSNVIYGAERSGIWIVTSSRRLNVIGNYVTACGSGSNDAGICVNATSTHNIEGNFLQNNNNVGIFVDYCTNISVRDNFVDNNAGPQATGIYEFALASSSNAFTNNRVQGSTGPNWAIVNGVGSTYVNNTNLNPIGISELGSVTGRPAISRQSADVVIATLGGNITPTIANGRVKGDQITLILTQDATDSRTITWLSNVKKAGGALVLSTAAGAVDVCTFRWDGSSWIEVSRSMAVN